MKKFLSITIVWVAASALFVGLLGAANQIWKFQNGKLATSGFEGQVQSAQNLNHDMSSQPDIGLPPGNSNSAKTQRGPRPNGLTGFFEDEFGNVHLARSSTDDASENMQALSNSIGDPSQATQTILDVRQQLGNGVSSVFNDSELKKTADKVFKEELGRLESANQPAVDSAQKSEQPEKVGTDQHELTRQELPDREPPRPDFVSGSHSEITPSATTTSAVVARKFARQLDELANDFEDQQMFDYADRMREEANKLRGMARTK